MQKKIEKYGKSMNFYSKKKITGIIVDLDKFIKKFSFCLLKSIWKEKKNSCWKTVGRAKLNKKLLSTVVLKGVLLVKIF